MYEWFDEAAYILKRIEEEGYKAYYVGGCVRDFVLNKPIKDIDIASSAKPEEIQRIFPKTIPVGIEHGTIIVRHNHVSYEVTTFRKEDNYEDFRRPSRVWFVTELEEDLSRRDFTFNAMAMDVSLQLHDPFNGREDLRKKQIRTVGMPTVRFAEDPLRLMRACRFMSVYNMAIEHETKNAIFDKAPMLKHISTERITEEFKRLLEGEWAGTALQFMKDSRLFSYLPYPITEKSKCSLSRFPWASLTKEEQRWAAVLVMTENEDARSWLKRWKLSNTMIRKVLDVISAFETKEWTRMKLYSSGIENALLGLELQCLMAGTPSDEKRKNLKQMFRDIPIVSRNDLPLNGEDVLSIKEQAPGTWVGQLFSEMEKAVVEGELSSSKEKLFEWVRKWEEK